MRNGTPANQLAGLEHLPEDLFFKNGQGNFTLSSFSYYDDTSLFSTVGLSPNASSVIVAGTTANLFSTVVGEAGGLGIGTRGGTAVNNTLVDTNMERGWQSGKAPANQAYIGVSGGFDVYYVDTNGSYLPFNNPSQMHQILSNTVWSWNAGGSASPVVQYEPLKLWPCGFGAYAFGVAAAATTGTNTFTYSGVANGGPASKMRKFTFPLVFYPETAVTCKLTVTKDITLTGSLSAPTNLSQIRIAFYLRGYKLSRIVG